MWQCIIITDYAIGTGCSIFTFDGDLEYHKDKVQLGPV